MEAVIEGINGSFIGYGFGCIFDDVPSLDECSS